MYRRLEILHPEINYTFHGRVQKVHAEKLGIMGAADTSWAEVLRGPNKPIPSNTRFFFTEKGWEEVGRHTVAGCKQQGQHVKVIAVKESSVNVVWGDEYEVAVQPKRSRSRKNRWYY